MMWGKVAPYICLRTNNVAINSFSKLLRHSGTSYRTYSHSYSNNSNKIPSVLLKCSDGNFRYDKLARSLFQFESSPLIEVNDITTAKGEALDQIWLNDPDLTNRQLIERLNFISNHCHQNDVSITSEEYDIFIDNLTRKMSEFHENEVIACLQIFSRMPFKNPKISSRNFVELLTALDENCSRHAVDWDLDKRLAVCDIWISVPMANKTKFSKLICEKLAEDLRYMNASQLVQAVRVSNFLRRYVEKVHAFEPYFASAFDELSLESIGGLCYTYNLVNAHVRTTEMVHKILSKAVVEDLSELSDFSLGQLVKVGQGSSSGDHSLVKYISQFRRKALSFSKRFFLSLF